MDESCLIAKNLKYTPERELEILGLLADGLTNQEIADQLVLEVGTVKSHNYNIFGKLDVKNRGQAVKRARELNLL